jgi:hypothetical protein
MKAIARIALVGTTQKRRPASGGALWGTTGRRDMYLYVCGSVGGNRVR